MIKIKGGRYERLIISATNRDLYIVDENIIATTKIRNNYSGTLSKVIALPTITIVVTHSRS